jgi:thymidylate synthase
MYQYLYPFGHQIFGETIGEIWISLIGAILEDGEFSYDEGRNRLAIQAARLKAHRQTIPDKIIKEYGNKKNLDEMIDLFFRETKMRDFDVLPSFPPGAKSYYGRLKEGKMEEFVVKRLTKYPESKKTIMVYPTWDDYKQVLENPDDDYLPCITTVHFRMIRNQNSGYKLNTITYARSIDAHQKAYANFWTIAMLTERIAKQLKETLKKDIVAGSFDLLVGDAHIYEETLEDAKKLFKEFKSFKCKY